MTPEQYASAVTASSKAACKERLVQINSKFAENPCLGPGCSSTETGAPSSLGVLLAVAGALMARRLR